MDDLAHISSRKRKADGDDCQRPDSQDPVEILPDPDGAPRQTCLTTDADVWPASTIPHVSSPLSAFGYQPRPVKRPRIESESPPASPVRPPSRKRHSSRTNARPALPRYGNDVEDVGIVQVSDPGPSSGSLLQLRSQSSHPQTIHKISPSVIPIDPNSLHIPSVQPLINRQTLKELDLDAILRNPQLRHDLLFDAGLQFRPTSSRRKREMSEIYWLAVTQELETGCTCVSFDSRGRPHSTICACETLAKPASNPSVAFSPSLHVVTLRMPSRIRPLLTEFLEVLLSVIQPLSSVSGMYVNPATFKSQMEEHAVQAAYLRSVFDPELIEQELEHHLFDPSGLFCSIGNTLKGHCAPMRDRSIDAMIDLAQTCAPGGTGTKADAVKAVRMCMDILELMKLDIANHQLQTLRPFLIRTSGQFELKAFKGRLVGDLPLKITREWIRSAHQTILASDYIIPHPPRQPLPATYSTLCLNQQVFLSVLRGLTDLVFNPPSSIPLTRSPLPTTPLSQLPLPAISSLPGYPETTYLDNARLITLSVDATEAAVLYLYLLLYRQLILSDCGSQDACKVTQADLLKMKKEIHDVGSSHLAHGFHSESLSAGEISRDREPKDAEKWRTVKQDIVLQIAMRAAEAQCPSSERPSGGDVPGQKILGIAQRWADSNMHPTSPLSTMVRNRLRDVVFGAVVRLVYPGDAANGEKFSVDLESLGLAGQSVDVALGSASGMEPLADEIRMLAERLARLALVHLNAYLPLYEQADFL